MAIQRIYWDTSCFIAYLSSSHPSEYERALICKDILEHAQRDDIELFTSSWAIVETIRPRKEYVPSPLPLWVASFEQKDKDGKLMFPNAMQQFQEIWGYYDKRNNSPARKLTEEEAEIIKNLFTYPFVRKITVDPVIASRAAEIARGTSLRPADSLHVASALAAQCTCIQSWDRDYSATTDLIPWQKPERLSPQGVLPELIAPPQQTEFRLTPPAQSQGAE